MDRTLSCGQWIADIRQTMPQALAAWLYGSAATGQLRDDSDVDIAVFSSQPMTADRRQALTHELARRWNRDVDLVDFARAPTVLQHEILRTGHCLFVVDAAKVANYEAFVRSEYLNWQALHHDQLHDIFQRGYVLGRTADTAKAQP